jgi:hypothetical protein
MEKQIYHIELKNVRFAPRKKLYSIRFEVPPQFTGGT